MAATQGRIEEEPNIAGPDRLCEFTIPDKFQIDHLAEKTGVSCIPEDVKLHLASTCLLDNQPTSHLVIGHVSGEDSVHRLQRIRFDERSRGVDRDIAGPVVKKCAENSAFDRLRLPLFRNPSARCDGGVERAW